MDAYQLGQNATRATGNFSSNLTYFLIAAVIVAASVGFGLLFWNRGQTMPVVQGFKTKEGFAGVAVGAGVPDCLRSSSTASQLYSLVADSGKTEEGPADFREFTLLLSQLSCFKKDLLGVAGVVESTRYQEFNTQLDLEPVAETTARCFAKTIPPRDLDLAFTKWQKRGHFLLTRLCTSANLSERQVVEGERLFESLIADVKSAAISKCLSGEPTINSQGSPRDVKSYLPPSLLALGTYMGYY